MKGMEVLSQCEQNSKSFFPLRSPKFVPHSAMIDVGLKIKRAVSTELRLVFWFCSIIGAETAIRCYKALLSSSFEASSVRAVQTYVPASSHELAEMLGGGRQLLACPYHLIRECSLCPLVYVEDRIDGLFL